jgi:hypothetical protein
MINVEWKPHAQIQIIIRHFITPTKLMKRIFELAWMN